RHKFHLKLYNRYQILKETNIDLQDNKDYLNLPSQQVINPADINIGCSHRQVRKKLERAKKYTTDGKEVSKAKVILSEAPITTTNASISECQTSFNLHVGYPGQLQRFYLSKKRAKLQRQRKEKNSFKKR
ncbi:hypothetical protein BCV72DRAFT_205020, partial [Rhizopus microsporus var. microsporus]